MENIVIDRIEKNLNTLLSCTNRSKIDLDLIIIEYERKKTKILNLFLN